MTLMDDPWRMFVSGFGCGIAAAWLYSRANEGKPSAFKLKNKVLAQRPNLVQTKDHDIHGSKLRRLRKCEAVIQRRTSRIILVIERSTKSHNYSAVIRTAEALGIQHLWVISPPELDKDAKDRRRRYKKRDQFTADAVELEEHVVFARKASKWISLRTFRSTEECIYALEQDKREIWVTDLSQDALPLTCGALSLPPRMALVIGTESTGASPAMLRVATKRVYLPLHGFADSLNLSVATAMVIQRLLFIDPSVVGDMPKHEQQQLRAKWYPEMGRNEKQKLEFAAMVRTPVKPFDDLRRPNAHRKPYVSKKVREHNRAAGFLSGIGTDV